MQSYNFTTKVHGKWLLAGEHAVLRGTPALVYPFFDKSLLFNFIANDTLSIVVTGEHQEHLATIINQVLIHSSKILQCNTFTGKFIIENNIPLGAGLGLSAAICAAVSRWLAFKNIIPAKQINDFAHQLEHLFHGESSGVDVAGVTASTGVVFKDGKQHQLIKQTWQPTWYLSYCEQPGITAKCVKIVKDLWKSDLPLAQKIDALMHESVELAMEALANPKTTGLQQLADAINVANNCFKMWGLYSEKIDNHIQVLLQAGAIAAKPTGSGAGGFILSLWESPPPNNIKNTLHYLSNKNS